MKSTASSRTVEDNCIWAKNMMTARSSGFDKLLEMPVELWAYFTQSSMAKYLSILVTAHYFFCVSKSVEPGTPLAKLLETAKTMNTAERAELLENSEDLERA